MIGMLPRGETYRDVYDAFRWRIPERYNIVRDVCDRHASDPAKIALIHERPDGSVREITFRELDRTANQLANTFVAAGLKKGDRVLVLLTQDPMTAVVHIACWKAGLVSIPTAILFGTDAIAYRLKIAEASAVVTDAENYPKVDEARNEAPSVRRVYLIDGADARAEDLRIVLPKASDRFETVDTAAEDPAMINFTSGTTGWPKGALHVHRVMLGHIPGNEFYYDFFPQPGDRMWSPADWAWIAGIMDVLMPALYFGVPVVTFRAKKFDPEQAYAMMGKHGVRTAFLMPTALKLLRQIPGGAKKSGTKLRAVMSGSESVGRDLLDWASSELGVQVNEGFGQTEANLVIGNCARIMPVKSGSLGKAVPGHVAAIVNDAGEIVKTGDVGNIAIKRPDPVFMKEYWRNPEATEKKYAGDWLLTGDLGREDEDGYLWYQGRADDVITSSGYRIGPGEIEDALVRHEAIVMAAAIGVPDPQRTESIKAFVVLGEGRKGDDALAEEIKAFVRDRLARHEMPRAIEFVDALPMTTTGKIMRRTLREQEIAKQKAD